MDRRRFLKVAATGAVGAAALTVAGCEQAGVMTPGQLEGAVSEDASLPEIEWQMATSWPPAGRPPSIRSSAAPRLSPSASSP